MKTRPWRRAVHHVRDTAAPAGRALTRRARRLRGWAGVRRRTALSQLLRGICFGSGSGLITAVVFWLTHH
ncbi:hypothetical protein AB0N81_32785 [Streptomyces sp. NPDC093510]|uniref:hypothetical protein n=1 Tax=Streptomyces sp. NPDC093510 TaxID=3155199 RepID=UPI00341CAF12